MLSVFAAGFVKLAFLREGLLRLVPSQAKGKVWMRFCYTSFKIIMHCKN